MLVRKFLDKTTYFILPVLGVAFGTLSYFMRGGALLKVFPYFDTFVTFVVMLTLERIWTYYKAKSQRHMIWRDMMSTAVQTFVAAAVMAAVVLPILHYGPETFLGRRIMFGLSDQLGPLWVQVIAAFLLSSLWHYWVHRYEHTNDFLWKLHGYHHSVTNVQISNVLVSNPLDWALRNVLGGLVLGLIGFNPVAIVFAGALALNYGNFSHSGTDAKGGWFNYIFNGPEVHRWHHATAYPDDPKFRYGCNFGVSDTFWDQLFGTFYLPKDAHGNVIPPDAIGHPEGYPDEPHYLKILFAARCFPALNRMFDKWAEIKNGKAGGSSVTVPAE
jgi:sterol desaturase/sphingolipid hydroxylase (fatty acid hydroxylase superfamily)